MKRRVIYVIYTNPAAYPPLEHSSRILAKAGWKVLFLGIGASGSADQLHFPTHENIKVRQLKYCAPGWRQKLHFIGFSLWALGWVLWWRPKWIYASDLLSCPTAVALSFLPGLQVVYHEHDSPISDSRFPISDFLKFVLWSRKKLAWRAAFCILPNEERIEVFKEQTGTKRLVLCVWNCPSRQEVVSPALRRNRFTIYYHGNLGPDLVPVSLLEAIAAVPEAHLLAVGYTTRSSNSHPETLRREAERLNIGERVEIRPPLCRRELLELTRTSHVGWAVIPRRPADLNFLHIVGASNKVFDYLACGLPALVLGSQEWTKTFVAPGYGLTCDPQNTQSIVEALRWFMEHPEETRQMGERGRLRILSEWNYETQFRHVEESLFGL